MHIMEGFLPLSWCIVWWLIALPCLALGVIRLKKVVTADREALPLLGVTGGFIFILSSLKLPSVTGSCSHPTGTGLAAICFGPWVAARGRRISELNREAQREYERTHQAGPRIQQG